MQNKAHQIKLGNHQFWAWWIFLGEKPIVNCSVFSFANLMGSIPPSHHHRNQWNYLSSYWYLLYGCRLHVLLDHRRWQKDKVIWFRTHVLRNKEKFYSFCCQRNNRSNYHKNESQIRLESVWLSVTISTIVRQIMLISFIRTWNEYSSYKTI